MSLCDIENIEEDVESELSNLVVYHHPASGKLVELDTVTALTDAKVQQMNTAGIVFVMQVTSNFYIAKVLANDGGTDLPSYVLYNPGVFTAIPTGEYYVRTLVPYIDGLPDVNDGGVMQIVGLTSEIDPENIPPVTAIETIQLHYDDSFLSPPYVRFRTPTETNADLDIYQLYRFEFDPLGLLPALADTFQRFTINGNAASSTLGNLPAWLLGGTPLFAAEPWDLKLDPVARFAYVFVASSVTNKRFGSTLKTSLELSAFDTPPTVPVTKTFDHQANVVPRLATQFKESANLINYLRAILTQANELEGAFCQVFNERWLDVAIGTQLDTIGSLVGQQREFVDDEDNPGEIRVQTDAEYRVYIDARIVRNTTTATVEQVITQAQVILGDDVAIFITEGTAWFTLSVAVLLTDNEKRLLTESGLLAKPAGVHFNLGVNYDPDDFFGFLGVPNAKGFGSLTVPGSGGLFAGTI